MLPVLIEVQVVAGELSAETETVDFYQTLVLLVNVSVVDKIGRGRVVLNFIVVDNRVLVRKNFGDGVGQYPRWRSNSDVVR